jgi:hypothetical protein
MINGEFDAKVFVVSRGGCFVLGVCSGRAVTVHFNAASRRV